MPTYLHPGVYIEEVPSGARPIEAVQTSTAAFIGYGKKGPINEPVAVNKWDDYLEKYGAISSREDYEDYLGMALWAYFLNGGRKTFVMRLASNAIKSKITEVQNTIGNSNKKSVITVEAKNPGIWGDDLRIRIINKNDDRHFTLIVGKRKSSDSTEYEDLERFENIEINERSAAYFKSVINGSSKYIEVDFPETAKDNPESYFIEGTSVSAILDNDTAAAVPEGFNKLTDLRDLTLNIDGRGNRTIKLDTSSTVDSINKIMGLIVDEVKKLGEEACYQEFSASCETCNTDKYKVTLKSGSGHKSYASVVVISGSLANLLKLGTSYKGEEKHGAQEVIPDSTVNNATGDPVFVPLSGGHDGYEPGLLQYQQAFSQLKKFQEISIIVLPGRDAKNHYNIIGAAISHCELIGNRMVLVDPPNNEVLTDLNKVNAIKAPDSQYSALYYPWIMVANPKYDPELNPDVRKTIPIAPSAFAAGIWAKTDAKRGTWKAPAGIETALLGAVKLQFHVEDSDQNVLNERGVNCIRTMPGYGSVIWGSRTLASKTAPEWRYIPVRRTAIMIKQSIQNAIQWAVFETNGHSLWSALRINIEAFMNGLFRAGAFQGKKASDAYFVRCGLDDTMTQADIDRGQVIVMVGFAPLKPAEFVIVRIQQKVGEI